MDKQQLTNLQTQTNLTKGASSNNAYQSTFLPYFQRTETKIKQLILYAYWNMLSRSELLKRINEIIVECDNKIDNKLMNKSDYINGMREKSMKLVKEFYDKPKARFIAIISALTSAFLLKKSVDSKYEKTELPKIETPRSLANIIRTTNKNTSERKLVIDIWSEAKGNVGNVQDFTKRLKFMVNDMSEKVMTTSSENGKHPISLWQKAEMDIRSQNQMKMISELKENGVQLAYISSHPNCSKRCEAFQGCLVSLNEHAPNPQREIKRNDFKDLDKKSYRVRKFGNEWVYSLPDILATETGGGYRNMIIGGFNCRHKLIPYTPNTPKPNVYDSSDIAKQRDIESRIRFMEREIRQLKQKEILFKQNNDIMNAKFVHNQIERKIFEYKHFCEKNGYAWYEYRIMI